MQLRDKLLIFGVFVGFVALVLPISPELTINNTNLAPNSPGHPSGTGERIDNVTYWTNSSKIDLHVFAHASSSSQTASVFVYVNDILVSPRAGRPLSLSEETYQGVDITIPKGAFYRVDFSNFHHYEWREWEYQ